MATYVNDLRLTELATGEGSGTWGTTTNTNLELIGEALGYATQQAFGSDADTTTTVADGVSDPARAMYYKVTSAVSLTATRTLTIAPNTLSRVMFIENATTGSQSIAISQGSGANVTIATGKTAVVYLDGAGATAAVVDAMAGVDPGVTDTLAEVLVAGNTTGGTNIELTTTDKVQFRDTAIYINSSVDGQLDIVADTEVQIAATTIDVNGTLAFDSLKGTGATTVTNILDEDNMGSDSATALATQQSIKAYVDSQVGTVDTLAEILANGNTTGGTDIAVGTGDDITFADSSKAIFGAGSDLEIYHDGLNSYIKDAGTGNLNIQTNGVGVVIEHTDGTNLAVFNAGDGTASLYHSGNLKLATTATGIDVTGTVTADGLTVQTTNGLNALLESSNSYQYLQFKNTDETNNYIGFVSDDFVVSPANNQKLIVTAEGNVGIGTSSPSTYDSRANNLVVGDSGDAGVTIFSGATSVARLVFAASGDTGLANGVIGYDNNNDSLAFEVAGSERMRISSTGKVGIGMDPDTNNVLSVKNTSGKVINLTNGVNADLYVDLTSGLTLVSPSTGTLAFGTSSTERMRIDASGNVGIGKTPNTNFGGYVLQLNGGSQTFMSFGNSTVGTTLSDGLVIGCDSTGADIYQREAQPLRFHTSNTERMRIDSSGNVGIGTSNIYGDLHLQGGQQDIILTNTNADGVAGATIGRFISQARGYGNNGAEFASIDFETNSSAWFKGDIVFKTNNSDGTNPAIDAAERMRIDASGFVGIKTTPNAWKTAWSVLDIGVSGSLFAQDNNTTGLSNNLYFTGSDWVHKNTGQTVLYQQSEGLHLFYSNASQAAGATFSPTERMRIDASGNLLVGRTSVAATGNGHSIRGGDSAVFSRDSSGETMIVGRNASAGDLVRFYCNGIDRGSINFDGGNTISYTSSSDRRLKENIADADDAGSKIDAIQVRKFDWKADGSHQDYGMVAQELLEVAPEAVSQGETEDDMMGVDYSKLVPVMLKEIQSLRARVAQLES